MYIFLLASLLLVFSNSAGMEEENRGKSGNNGMPEPVTIRELEFLCRLSEYHNRRPERYKILLHEKKKYFRDQFKLQKEWYKPIDEINHCIERVLLSEGSSIATALGHPCTNDSPVADELVLYKAYGEALTVSLSLLSLWKYFAGTAPKFSDFFNTFMKDTPRDFEVEHVQSAEQDAVSFDKRGPVLIHTSNAGDILLSKEVANIESAREIWHEKVPSKTLFLETPEAQCAWLRLNDPSRDKESVLIRWLSNKNENDITYGSEEVRSVYGYFVCYGSLDANYMLNLVPLASSIENYFERAAQLETRSLYKRDTLSVLEKQALEVATASLLNVVLIPAFATTHFFGNSTILRSYFETKKINKDIQSVTDDYALIDTIRALFCGAKTGALYNKLYQRIFHEHQRIDGILRNNSDSLSNKNLIFDTPFEQDFSQCAIFSLNKSDVPISVQETQQGLTAIENELQSDSFQDKVKKCAHSPIHSMPFKHAPNCIEYLIMDSVYNEKLCKFSDGKWERFSRVVDRSIAQNESFFHIPALHSTWKIGIFSMNFMNGHKQPLLLGLKLNKAGVCSARYVSMVINGFGYEELYNIMKNEQQCDLHYKKRPITDKDVLPSVQSTENHFCQFLTFTSKDIKKQVASIAIFKGLHAQQNLAKINDASIPPQIKKAAKKKGKSKKKKTK